MIWQRHPLENKCDQKRDEEFLGLDFLIPASYIVWHRTRTLKGLKTELELDSNDIADEDADQG